jgi:hypothetical protein
VYKKEKEAKCAAATPSPIDARPEDELSSALIRQVDSLNAHKLVFDPTSGRAFKFVETDQYGRPVEVNNGLLGVCSFRNKVLEGCPSEKRKTITMFWIANHLRWVVWKLASYETRFPILMKRCLCSDEVLAQLRHRCQRENELCQSSALKRICNNEISPSALMVLVVSRVVVGPVYGQEGGPDENAAKNDRNLKSSMFVELTDGWYRILAQLDAGLSSQCAAGRIAEGSKICVCGAGFCDDSNGSTDSLLGEIMNLPEECNRPMCYLQLHSNGTRMARPGARLGLQKSTPTMPIVLKSVLPEGGVVPSIDIVVLKLYPMQYLSSDKDSSGRKTNTILNQNGEDKKQKQQELELDKKTEAIRMKLQNDILRCNVEPHDSVFNDMELAIRNLRENFERKRSSPFIEIKITDFRRGAKGTSGNVAASHTYMTIWNPPEDKYLEPGKRYRVTNLTPFRSRDAFDEPGETQSRLKASKKTQIFHMAASEEDLRVSGFPLHPPYSIGELSFQEPIQHVEFDFVGVLVFYQPKSSGRPARTTTSAQAMNLGDATVFLTDDTEQLISIDLAGATLSSSCLDSLKRASSTVSSRKRTRRSMGGLKPSGSSESPLVLCFQNIRYANYDGSYKLCIASCTKNSFVSRDAPSNRPVLNEAVTRLKTFLGATATPTSAVKSAQKSRNRRKSEGAGNLLKTDTKLRKSPSLIGGRGACLLATLKLRAASIIDGTFVPTDSNAVLVRGTPDDEVSHSQPEPVHYPTPSQSQLHSQAPLRPQSHSSAEVVGHVHDICAISVEGVEGTQLCLVVDNGAEVFPLMLPPADIHSLLHQSLAYDRHAESIVSIGYLERLKAEEKCQWCGSDNNARQHPPDLNVPQGLDSLVKMCHQNLNAVMASAALTFSRSGAQMQNIKGDRTTSIRDDGMDQFHQCCCSKRGAHVLSVFVHLLSQPTFQFKFVKLQGICLVPPFLHAICCLS